MRATGQIRRLTPNVGQYRPERTRWRSRAVRWCPTTPRIDGSIRFPVAVMDREEGHAEAWRIASPVHDGR
jgi:hypothetical protein